MDVVSEAVAGMGEQLAVLAKACDELSHRELVGLLVELSRLMRSVPALEHQILGRLLAETEPCRLGEASWKKVLTTALRVSGAEAARRLARAKTLGPRRAISGAPLAPLWEATAAAQAQGLLDEAHVSAIAWFHKKLPSWVDVDTRAQADAELAGLGSGLCPENLNACTRYLLAKIDQDGPEPDAQERARRRGIRIGRQQRDGYSRISGWVTAAGRALLEAVFASQAAPGHNIPDDETPDTDETPDAHADAEAADADHSSEGDGEPDNDAEAPDADAMPGTDEEADGGDSEAPDAVETPDNDAEAVETPDNDAEAAGAEETPDESPAQDHDPHPDPRGSDTRTQEQRQHDALVAVCRRVLESGTLGHHNGLPLTVIASVSLQELQKAAGVAVTGGGSFIPMRELIQMAANAYHYVCHERRSESAM